MPLSSEEMNKIAIEEIQGRQPSISGPEQDQFRATMRRDIASAKQNGYVLDIPPEWPDVGGGESPDGGQESPPSDPRIQKAKESFDHRGY